MKRNIMAVLASIAFLCSGSSYLYALPDGSVARLGRFNSTIDGFNRGGCFAFSPSGDILAEVAYAEIHFYDPVTLAEVALLEIDKDISAIAFNSDGSILAVATDNHAIFQDDDIELWSVAELNKISVLKGHHLPVISISFSPDGNFLACSSGFSEVEIWDLAINKQIATLEGDQRDLLLCVSFSPDGSMLASGSVGAVKLWDFENRKEIALLKHEGGVRSITFSPDGSMLASVNSERIIKLWDLVAYKYIAGSRNITSSGKVFVSFSPDSSMLAYGDFGGVKLWDVSTQEEVATLEGHKESVIYTAFSPDGSILASVSSEGTIKMWNLQARKEIATHQGHNLSISVLSFNPAGNLLASGGYDGSVKLWDLETHKEVALLEGHEGGVISIAFSPDGSLLASGSRDSNVKLWDVATHREIATFEGHQWSVCSVAFSPDGAMLASGGWDETVKLWDTVNRVSVANFDGHFNDVDSVCFSPYGLLASGGMDGTIVLWDVNPYIAFPIQRTVEPGDKISVSWGSVRNGKDIYAIGQNYPNPFNPDTWIPYALAEPSDVAIKIHNAAGLLVRTLNLGKKVAGVYLSRDKAAYWNGRDGNGEPVASGVYFYTLCAGDYIATKKMIIVK